MLVACPERDIRVGTTFGGSCGGLVGGWNFGDGFGPDGCVVLAFLIVGFRGVGVGRCAALGFPLHPGNNWASR